jgi:hypothetical protein
MLRRFMPERLGKYGDYMAFTKRFCGGYQGKWGWDDRGASNIEELATYLDGFMLRRLKKDVMTELPDKIYQKILFDAPSKAVKTLLEKERQESLEDRLGAFSSARQEVGLAKLPLVIEHLENLLEEVDKVIVFAHHRAVLEGLRDRLYNHKPVLLYGGLTAEQKQRTINDFVADPKRRVFLGQIDAAGTGIDGLQKVASTIVFAEISWVPGQIRQAIDRCHRIGQKNKVLVQFLMMKGGIDEQIYDSIGGKSEVIRKLVNTNAAPKPEEEGSTMPSLEQNIERIANALEKIANPVMTMPTVQVDPDPAPAIPESKPRKTLAKPAPKAAAVEAPKAPTAMDSKGLLAYANSKVLAVKDAETRKLIVKTIMENIKEELGVPSIGNVPADRIGDAKCIVDSAFSAGGVDTDDPTIS